MSESDTQEAAVGLLAWPILANGSVMSICPCCGQERKPAANSTLWLDPALLAVCNDAFAAAVRMGAREVTVAHLAYALAASVTGAQAFGRLGLVASDLAIAAEAAMGQARAGEAEATPPASFDLRLLLERAQLVAREQGRDAASIDDMLFALTHRCRDLASADKINQQRAAAARARRLASNRCDRTPGASLAANAGFATEGSRQAGHGASGEDRSNSQWNQRGLLVAGVTAGFAAEGRAANPHAWQQPLRVEVAALHGAPRGSDHASQSSYPYHHRPDGALGRRSGADLGAYEGQSLAERLNQQDRLIAELCLRLANGEGGSARGGRGQARTSEGKSERASRRNGQQNGQDASGKRQRAERTSTRTELEGEAQALASATANGGGNGGVGRGSSVREGSARTTNRASWRRVRRAPWMRRLKPGAANAFDGATHPGSSDDDNPGNAELGEDDDIVDPSREKEKRFYLALDDEISRAPSIGPKTAARLAPHGIARVRDLLRADPAQLAAAVGMRHITKRRVGEWIAQARLVCVIPWLRGTHAQLLVGAGFTVPEGIVAADPSAVCAAILRFAATREGQGILRSGAPPAIERMLRWVEYASLAEPERAAA